MTPSEDRYARQVRYGPIGSSGQAAISNADVAVLGCGALGTVAAEVLARAGVGRLRLIDRDVVEWTNLQRQSLFDENDARVANAKAEAAQRRLAEINAGIEIEPLVVDVSAANIGGLLGGVDLVIDATDNFLVRFLLNDWSLSTETPWVHGGCVGATGQVRLFTGRSPCFRCLVPELPPAASVDTCDTAGVVGSATHCIASLQATEAIKWLSGNREHVSEDLLSIDLWNNRIRYLKLGAGMSGDCKACKHGRWEFLQGDHSAVPEQTLCGRDAVQIASPTTTRIDVDAIASRWQGMGELQKTRFFIRLHLGSEQTITLFRDGRAVIAGTDDISVARTLYHRYVGG